ncbi:MAG: monovalent cation/H+ antiporter complex subunit F [Treponema sp.]|nr:monovalent cation/H+ antiporter complex subunit F [Treponema sp.]
MEILLWVMLAYLVLFLVRVVRGPSIWDRLLGMSLVSTKIIVIIVISASLTESAFLLDFAIIYALFGFIGIIFVALFLAERSSGKKKEER